MGISRTFKGFTKGMTIFLGLLILISTMNCSSNREARSPVVRTLESPTPAQLVRRNASSQILRSHGIPVNDEQTFLHIDRDEVIKLRKKDEVVDRALALCYVGLKSEQTDPRHLEFFDNKFKALSKLTSKELTMVLTGASSLQLSAANWRYESLHVMLWALGYVDSLSFPSHTSHVGEDVLKIIPLTETEFRERAVLRSAKEILDQADLVLRLKMACNKARMGKTEMPETVNERVVDERYFAINWLIKYLNKDWDEIVDDQY